MRPALGLKYAGDGAIIARIPAQPVNRFRRKADQPARPQNSGGGGDIIWCCAKTLGCYLHK